MAANNITIEFEGPGRYWLNVNKSGLTGSIDLGDCVTEAQVKRAVREVVETSSGDKNWNGWIAQL